MKIIIGSDHAAYEMKQIVSDYLRLKNIEVVDVGTHSNDRADYPDYAKALVKFVIEDDVKGILLCGSGIGMSMAANRFKGIRAALCRSPLDAEMSRKHNDANVLCLGARSNTKDELISIIDSFLTSEFEGGRHSDRLLKFNK